MQLFGDIGLDNAGKRQQKVASSSVFNFFFVCLGRFCLARSNQLSEDSSVELTTELLTRALPPLDPPWTAVL